MSGRRDKGGGGHGGGGEERWLLPYADMITLLLGLFIVLFAMSSVDASKFDAVKQELAVQFKGAILDETGGVLPGSNGVLDPTALADAEVDSVAISASSRQAAQRFEEETRKLDQMAKQLNLGNDVKVTRNELGIQISIAGDALFASGQYELSSPGIKDELTRIAGELRTFGAPIRIEGHTDGAPYPSRFGNEGLSAMRALAVQEFFQRKGFPRSLMHVAGFGAERPKVKPPTPTASVAGNRRIEVIILEPGAQDGFDNEAVETAVRTQRERDGTARRSPAAKLVDSAVKGEFALVDELATTGKGVE